METHAEGYTAQVPDREFDFFVQGFRLTVMDGRMILADLERRGRPDETWYAPPHTHSWYELFCAEKREMRYQVDGGERVLKEGECLLVAPGCVHATMPDPEGVRFTFAFFLQKEHGSSPRAFWSRCCSGRGPGLSRWTRRASASPSPLPGP